MERKQNFLGLPVEVLLQLVENKQLEMICSKKSEGYRNKYKNDIKNLYFRIKGKNNMVFLYISGGYGIVISEWITSKAGMAINLVDELSEYYWYIDKKNDTVKSAVLGNRTLYRCLGSLMEYGDITRKLPRELEVHHKFSRYCNTKENLVVVDCEKHKNFHNNISNKKSKRRGIVIESTADFTMWIDNLEKMNARFANKEM